MEAKLIYLKDNIVHNFIEALPGWTIKDCFSAEFLADCVPWQDGVIEGMVYDPETKTFNLPPEPEPPAPPQPDKVDELQEAIRILTGGADDELDSIISNGA